jgi:hypothetical protein
MFPSTIGGVNSSSLQFRVPVDSSGTESDLQHPVMPLSVFERRSICCVPYRNGQSVPLLKPRARYSSAVSSFISNLRDARSREGQKEIGDCTETVKYVSVGTICLNRATLMFRRAARFSGEGLQTALGYRARVRQPLLAKKTGQGCFESRLKLPDV